MNPNPHEIVTPSRKSRQKKNKKQRKNFRRVALTTLASLAGLLVIMVAVGFLTPWGKNMRMLLAETIITTRHARLARYLVTSSEYSTLWSQINQPVANTGVPEQVQVTGANYSNPVEIQKISESTFNGYVMFVHNPKLIRLVKANVQGSMGEYITDMAKRVGADYGTNASGFEDPNGGGWGGLPVGMEMVDGQVIHPIDGTQSWTTVGFTSDGVMVMGQYSMSQLRNMGVRDAMQFHPELVVNGRPMITYGDGGWGYGPRTAIGQTRDGTVIFIVANGRFHGGSGAGASMKQVMDLMLQYGAVNACAMDGGSSSVLDDHGQIINSPSTIDPNHERHLPDAWLVFPSATAANNYHLS